MSKLEDVRPKRVKVKLDRERTLLFDLNAFALIEEAYGDIDQGLKALQEGSIRATRRFLWAALTHEDDKLTEKDVGRMVSLTDIEHLAHVVTEALMSALPSVQEDDKGKKQEETEAGTGPG